jgi:methylphosphotriester-DNA--protein-cysteine methyltransferase
MNSTPSPALLVTLEAQLGPDPINPAADLSLISANVAARLRQLSADLRVADQANLVALRATTHSLGHPNHAVLSTIQDARFAEVKRLLADIDSLLTMQNHAFDGIDMFCEGM